MWLAAVHDGSRTPFTVLGIVANPLRTATRAGGPVGDAATQLAETVTTRTRARMLPRERSPTLIRRPAIGGLSGIRVATAHVRLTCSSLTFRSGRLL